MHVDPVTDLLLSATVTSFSRRRLQDSRNEHKEREKEEGKEKGEKRKQRKEGVCRVEGVEAAEDQCMSVYVHVEVESHDAEEREGQIITGIPVNTFSKRKHAQNFFLEVVSSPSRLRPCSQASPGPFLSSFARLDD
jgi:hypothetical protein